MAVKRIRNWEHAHLMEKRREERKAREAGFDQLLPSVQEAQRVQHLNRKERRKWASKSFQKALKAIADKVRRQALKEAA